jgi:hypothetical protein
MFAQMRQHGEGEVHDLENIDLELLLNLFLQKRFKNSEGTEISAIDQRIDPANRAMTAPMAVWMPARSCTSKARHKHVNKRTDRNGTKFRTLLVTLCA